MVVHKNIMNDTISFFYYIVLFAVYCFMGWVIEVIYRSITQRKFVNAGFLFGPFVPIYGLGAFMIIVLQHVFQNWHFAPRFAVFGLAVTLMEYVVGFLSEKIFKLTLWDYSENRINLHGRVCLHFSILWTALSLVFVTFVHPEVLQRVFSLNESFVKYSAIAFMIYFWIDYTFSVMSLAAFRRAVGYLYEEYFNLSNAEIADNLKSFQRLLNAFPDLNKYIYSNINSSVKTRLNYFLKPVREKLIQEMAGRTPFEKEYYDTVREILQHEEFLKLKDYFHHNSSIYNHVHDVAYLSYRISKYLKLDYRSTARGALLHDFFLYDWRNHDVPDLPREKFHGLAHPAIAVANAKKYFAINDMEEDIIRKHMWPLTLVPPKYKESFIVSFADKYLSSREFIDEYKKRLNRFQENKTIKQKKENADG
jgi:uncharacterized membrane protein/HD superfamily phosphodiesterase